MTVLVHNGKARDGQNVAMNCQSRSNFASVLDCPKEVSDDYQLSMPEKFHGRVATNSLDPTAITNSFMLVQYNLFPCQWCLAQHRLEEACSCGHDSRHNLGKDKDIGNSNIRNG